MTNDKVLKRLTPLELVTPRDLRQSIAMHWHDDDPEGLQELASFDALVEKAACWDRVHELIKIDGKGVVLGYHNAEKKEEFGVWLQRSPYHTGSPTLEEAINIAPMNWRDAPCPAGINCGPCQLPCCVKGKRLKPEALCHHKCPSHKK